ncbi:VCBS repeat-containing protein [Hamadaea sp. NPDC050747]|uniref:FG-GAP repeat domain-containing protein n=1 Tax=Hamadaea sp. NPDC050747 TaxID=3155789 RepID=UPI0033D30E36
MKRTISKIVSGLATVTVSVALAVLVYAPDAYAIELRPCDPGGPTSQDLSIGQQLNTQLTKDMRGHMGAYETSCARVITQTVKARGLSSRAAVIAVTTVIVETHLQNLNGGDLDSIGLYQQRSGWGSATQRIDAVWATNRFLTEMLNLYPNNGWTTGNIGDICQSIQRSAYPDRYSVQVSDAQIIVNALWNLGSSSRLTGTVSDFSGDGHSDVLGVDSTGDLWYYPNNNLALSTTTRKQIGQGWGTFKHVMAADFSGDGYADVLGVDSTGDLWYYPNNGLALSTTTRKQLGQGWGTFKHVMAADFSGDGHADVLGVDSTGDLWYYPNNNLALSTTTRKQIGQGWGTFKQVMAADFSGDGHADVIGVDGTGDLWYYPNNNLALSTTTRKQLGQGWGTFKHVFASDFSGDEHADVIGVDGTGDLWYYPNNNLALSTTTRKQLGQGWSTYPFVM